METGVVKLEPLHSALFNEGDTFYILSGPERKPGVLYHVRRQVDEYLVVRYWARRRWHYELVPTHVYYLLAKDDRLRKGRMRYI